MEPDHRLQMWSSGQMCCPVGETSVFNFMYVDVEASEAFEEQVRLVEHQMGSNVLDA